MSEARAEFVAAFAAAQKEFPAIHKDKKAVIETKKGGSFSYAYADLPTILDLVSPVLEKHGLVVAQSAVSLNGGVGVETRIFHVGTGHCEVFGPLYLPGGDDARGAGSAVTYARRYSLCAALGIAADEDDDGASHQPTTNVKDGAAASHQPSTDAPVSEGEPHCPACMAVNGELVGVWENDKKPFWRCKNKPGDCAGSTESNGKQYQWSGWEQDWEKSAGVWLSDNGYSPVVREDPEVSGSDWLSNAVQMFNQWTVEQRKETAAQVAKEQGAKKPISLEEAKSVHAGMAAIYFEAFPDDGGAPF